MNKSLLVALVVFCLIARTHQWKRHPRRDRPCYPTATAIDVCDENKVCAWNKHMCPGYQGCYLICTDNPYKLCHGLEMGMMCMDGSGDYVCALDSRGERLVCTGNMCPMDYSLD